MRLSSKQKKVDCVNKVKKNNACLSRYYRILIKTQNRRNKQRIFRKW